MFERIASGSVVLVLPICGLFWFLDVIGPPPASVSAVVMVTCWIYALGQFVETFKE